MKRFLFAAAVGLLSVAFASPGNAVTFVFKYNGGVYDSPTGNIAMDCGSIPTDLCTDVDGDGFTYSKMGIEFTARAYASGIATQLIQDLQPDNSGLGALSENNYWDDQTQFDSGESIEFAFTQVVDLSNIEFNAGDDVDCSTPGPEGPCGFFDLYIDNVFYATLEAVDLLAGGFIGSTFRLDPITANAGFAVARFDVEAVPVPGAIFLLLSGLAGLNFASRRKRTG